MTSSERMHLDGSGPVRITKEIPLWGIITLLGALAAQAVALYYGQLEQAREMRRWGERQAEMASDIKSIAGEGQKAGRDMQEFGFQLRVLQDRVRALEQQVSVRK